MLLLVLAYQSLDSVIGIQESGDGIVVIQGVDDIGDVLAHSAADVVVAGEELFALVHQIGGDDLVDDPVRDGLVESGHTLGEEAEGGDDEDSVRPAALELRGDIDHGLAGSDHVVDDPDILALDGSAQEFVGYDGVAAVDDLGVVTALVEHAHLNAQDRGDVDGALGAAFIGGDDHQMIIVQLEVIAVMANSLDELICAGHGVKAVQGDGVLNPGIVRVEGDDIVDAHGDQLLQGQRAV